jgi:hypothetical protein
VCELAHAQKTNSALHFCSAVSIEAQPMKSLLVAFVLAFVLIGGVVTVAAVAANSAYADPNGNGGGGH